MPKTSTLVTVFFLIGILASCANEGIQPELPDAESTTGEDVELIEIMRGLEADLAEAAHGIWIQDPLIVSQAATRIAEHPKVPEAQLAIIKTALGRDLADFVQFDQLVHSSAVQLADSANASANSAVLFSIYHTIEQGCFSCHASFQQRVSEALSN